MKYKAVRGVRDLFGKDIDIFQYIEDKSRELFNSFCYQELRVPIFESVDVFNRSIGEETDIISKEMYVFEDRGERRLALRPEGTASVVRAAIENSLIQKDIENRFYYSGPMFRYDRPQAGRYRQFYQIGAELFGVKSPLLDMEIIFIAVTLLKNLGIDEFNVHVNTVGCSSCRGKYLEELKDYLSSRKTDLCDVCNVRLEENVLRVFDCKNEDCKNILKDAPKVTDFVCDTCAQDFGALKEYLKRINIEFVEDKSLVRGLDYYTGMVFELKTNLLGAQDALAAGGRYDNLVYNMGGENIPAVGFALGEDRLAVILSNKEPQMLSNKKIFFVFLSEDRNNEIVDKFDFIQQLRREKFIVRYDVNSKSMKAQMRSANNWNADYVLIVEENNKFSVKNMKTSEQITVSEEDVFQIINK